MSSTATIVIAVAAVVALAAIAFITMARRSDVRGAGALAAETRARDAAARSGAQAAATAESVASSVPTRAEVEAAGVAARAATSTAVAPARPAPVMPWTPPDPEAIAVSRRQFFNRAQVALMSVSIGTFAAAGFVAFLWPTGTGGFGQDIGVGKLQDIKDGARGNNGFFYAPNARAWLVEYPAEALPLAEAIYPESILVGMRQGIVALYQKCPHLGCRVPNCPTSRWFECGCHGSMYNQVGEKKGGPAPRGMDLFPVVIDDSGNVTVRTGSVVTGAVIGTNTTGQEAEGPHCVSAGGGH